MDSIKFTREQVALLCEPGVYIYRDEHRVLYVGATNFGIDRAFDHNHKMRKIPNTSLEFIPCESAAAALDLESELIAKLNPRFNVHRFSMGKHYFSSSAQDDFERVCMSAEEKKILFETISK